MITPGYIEKKDLIERINEVREARQTAVEDDNGEDEAEFDEDAASVASRLVSKNGGSNCSREESTDILRLRPSEVKCNTLACVRVCVHNLIMHTLIVVEWSPPISSDCDYCWN